ncbi:MAG TPA: NlpC/P60 family protein [Myxococcaceae bacterium]|nr:NlpC/P60 family protein [Myxococcaceae bacterium]
MTLRFLLLLAFIPLVGCVTPAARRRHVQPPPSYVTDPAPWEEAPAINPEVPPPPLVEDAPEEAEAPSQKGLRLAELASRYVGLKSLRKVTREVRDDCSGFVRLVYQGQGIELYQDGFLVNENGVAAIYRRAKTVGALRQEDPRPGDLVFFDNTYDRNRNGRMDDPLSHIGVVESVDGEGTVTFIHRHGPGVTRSRMNVRFGREYSGPDGRVFNDYLRRKTKKQRGYLSGELFVGYASPERL